MIKKITDNKSNFQKWKSINFYQHKQLFIKQINTQNPFKQLLKRVSVCRASFWMPAPMIRKSYSLRNYFFFFFSTTNAPTATTATPAIIAIVVVELLSGAVSSSAS